MTDISARFDRVTAQFTERVRAVPDDAWDNPSPCEGWTAREVVGHLNEWIPAFFSSYGVVFPAMPSVANDTVGAWETLRVTIARALDDPTLATNQVATPFSNQSLAETVDMVVTGDVFIHTWDLARATGQPETLDPDQLQRMIAGLQAMPEEALRAEGMFGPRIDVPADADDQTRFLAYVGRRV